jgi:hypothetical protein
VVWDCFDYLQMWPNLFVNYIIRIRNAAAHALVSLVRNLCSRSWVGNVHEPINRIICNFVLNLFLLWRNYPFFNKELTFFLCLNYQLCLSPHISARHIKGAHSWLTTYLTGTGELTIYLKDLLTF